MIVESMTSNDMVVREGTNVTLTCKAKGELVGPRGVDLFLLGGI